MTKTCNSSCQPWPPIHGLQDFGQFFGHFFHEFQRRQESDENFMKIMKFSPNSRRLWNCRIFDPENSAIPNFRTFRSLKIGRFSNFLSSEFQRCRGFWCVIHAKTPMSLEVMNYSWFSWIPAPHNRLEVAVNYSRSRSIRQSGMHKFMIFHEFREIHEFMNLRHSHKFMIFMKIINFMIFINLIMAITLWSL